ncbi:PP2C family protein-serine/threonine phosphatase [Cuniculiplasma sp. SKW3]|uniref:PP2C family protein-serine/threonine phosphatase n=1 Tax=Cuniculiplasma sp. SKW3 TaxID=3400170 RepID=UPI003FD315B8
MKINSNSVRGLLGKKNADAKPESEQMKNSKIGKYIFDSITHPGKIRENNEDSLLVSETSFFSQEKQASLIFAAIADGLGGMKDGEKASYVAVTKSYGYFIENLSFVISGVSYDKVLFKTLQKANSSINELNEKREKENHMASTLTLVAIGGSQGYFVHSGDCSIIKVNSKLEHLNKSHRMPKTNQIYSCLGVGKDVEVDSGVFTISEGDSILICSDGLTDMVSDNDIKRLVAQNKENPEKVCHSLVDLALENGGKDNVSIIYIYCNS